MTLPNQKSVLQKQIPTLLGLGILIIALIGGVFLLGTGPGVFAPRATPQTTPKNIRISNVSDSSFTISFLTDEATAGFIKYGKEQSSLKSQSSDDRDQLSGSVDKYTLHHVTVRGLDPGATYYYTLGTGSGAAFDNNGAPFAITTAKKSGTPSAAKTVYGSVSNAGGTPAEGSIVYVTMAGVGEMSSLVKNSGSWAIPLSNARTADGTGYATVKDDDSITISVQGPLAVQSTQITTTIAKAQPAEALTLGSSGAPLAVTTPDDTSVGGDSTASDSATSSNDAATLAVLPSTSPSPTTTTSDSDFLPVVGGSSSLNSINETSSASGSAASTSSATITRTPAASASPAASSSASTVAVTTLDLTKATAAVQPTVTTTQPIITGQAAPGVRVKISVHSDTVIEQELIADGKGGFTLDISKLENDPTLEPGEHTVTYSYTDPTTQKEITKTQKFIVKPPTGAVSTTTKTSTASATGTGGAVPFGSGNPYSTDATKSASTSTRVAMPATTSAIPKSGSVETTIALIVGGLFFIVASGWSFWVAQQWEELTQA
jgi:hypothetical protein